MRELLTKEAYGRGLIGHFGIFKMFEGLKEHFYWPKMRVDVEKVCGSCITCKQAKSKSHPHGLYTPLHVPNSV